jgi:hypothetical protein
MSVVFYVRDEVIVGEDQAVGQHRTGAWHPPTMLVDTL